MAVYYKFKSARDYDSIPMDGPFISVGTLKEKIFESKHLGRGTDFDLVVTNAQTNEEYLDEAMLIPKNTSVLIRRVPGRPRLPIVTEQEPKQETEVENSETEKNSLQMASNSTMKYSEDLDWDEFGNDLYAIPEVLPIQQSNSIPDAAPTDKADEESKIKALIEYSALDWQRQGAEGFGPGRGFGRGGRTGGRGFGLERKTPPQGYICHRCKVPGHYIQHCPTNGDPNFDIRRSKPPTGIPKSMLVPTPDGSYVLSSGTAAVLKPNEDAFDKEMEGIPTTRSVSELPPELHCPLCKEVMKDAVLTSKCCFQSFCDKCIRVHIISKSTCVCGASNVLADDLLPNKTLRDTINRILEFGSSSADNPGSTIQVQDMESARCPQPKILSPTTSAASKGERKVTLVKERTARVQETVNSGNAISAPFQTVEGVRTARAADVSEGTHESNTVKEPASQGSALLAEEEVQQKIVPYEAGKKKKKKKVRMPANDLQWKIPQDFGAENYMMPMVPSGYNPYWNGIPPGRDGFMGPYPVPMPYVGYGVGPLDMPFGGVMPQDPFGMQNYMMPVPPHQRDLADFSLYMNGPPPVMGREEFEARKADLRKRENDKHGESRDFPKDRDFGNQVSSGADVSSMKAKPKPNPPTSFSDYKLRSRSEGPSPDRSTHREVDPPPRPLKRKFEHSHRERVDKDRVFDQGNSHHDRHQHQHQQQQHHHHRSETSSRRSSEPATKNPSSSTAAASSANAAAVAERKHKASVFSRISFPEGEANKKRLSSSIQPTAADAGSSAPSAHHKAVPNGYYDEYKASDGNGRKMSTNAIDYESSDDERHFKRRPSRYEPSPSLPQPPQAEWEEGRHSSRGSKERKHR